MKTAGSMLFRGQLRGAAASVKTVARGAFCSLAVLVLSSHATMAHEVRPAIADVEIGATSIEIEIRLAIEALIAGIDLEGLEDTNAAPQAADYDRLRGLDPSALERELEAAWPGLRNGIVIRSGGQRFAPEISSVAIPVAGDVRIARDSVLTLAATLPPGGGPVEFGWIASFGPLVVRQMGAGEGAYTGYLTGGALSEPLPRAGIAEEGALAVALRYLVIGFEHIVPKGLDHILFVLGLFFLSLRLRALLIQVTAFTLAHTFTLALAMLEVVRVPSTIVEPLIAASIVYVAVENVLRSGMTRWRTLVVFCFGLLHGLGFASVLGEIGLDPARFAVGLISFNVGVELGQLAVILAAFLVVGVWFGSRSWYHARIAAPASIMIALIGAYWFVERVIA